MSYKDTENRPLTTRRMRRAWAYANIVFIAGSVAFDLATSFRPGINEPLWLVIPFFIAGHAIIGVLRAVVLNAVLGFLFLLLWPSTLLLRRNRQMPRPWEAADQPSAQLDDSGRQTIGQDKDGEPPQDLVSSK